MNTAYNPAANNDYEGSSEGACVSRMTDEDDVVRKLPANLIPYHCLCAGEVAMWSRNQLQVQCAMISHPVRQRSIPSLP